MRIAPVLRPLWLVALAIATLLATVAATPPTAEASTGSQARELRFVDSVNVERAGRGIDRLRLASDLTEVARRHSARMASDGDLRHNPSLGSEVSGWSRVGENVGRGGSVSSLHAALMDSESHRRNILDGQFTEIGVGVHLSGSTVWVTQVFRTPSGQVATASFSDVGGGTHAGSIARLADTGITTGCGDESYCPDGDVTRAQMATFLARASVLMPSSSDPFSDLDRAPMHRANISALADAGVTGGCEPGRFCPTRAVTRAQMATFLANALDLAPLSGSRFSDVHVGGVHAGAINAIAEAGITNGCDDGVFCPDQRVTRAEMASFLVRAFGL